MLSLSPSHIALDRARPDSSSHATELPTIGSWRDGSFAPASCGSTGLVVRTNTAYMTEIDRTAGARKQFINRPSRHLATRST